MSGKKKREKWQGQKKKTKGKREQQSKRKEKRKQDEAKKDKIKQDEWKKKLAQAELKLKSFYSGTGSRSGGRFHGSPFSTPEIFHQTKDGYTVASHWHGDRLYVFIHVICSRQNGLLTGSVLVYNLTDHTKDDYWYVHSHRTTEDEQDWAVEIL
eukprot:TRINITY_DN2661_c0_g1_i3.p1 TRINITY_DN2661_c0_g1~~TRINITY_DN2661_c0_g1_i3.p1  ORF type:complete len:154 (-),score=20.46 TRINITY_DN2661_c0_g1_i3:129-590(-)